MQVSSITDEQMLTQYMGTHYLGKIVVVLSFYSAFDDDGEIFHWLCNKLGDDQALRVCTGTGLNVFIICSDIDEAKNLVSDNENADIWVNQVWAEI